MPSVSNIDICAEIEALQGLVTAVISKLLRKLAILSRLAGLLELAGLNIPIPDVSRLLSLALIDINVYNQLRCACPFLHLPSTNLGDDVNKLRSQVFSAYAALDAVLAGHPHALMGMLQDRMDELLAELSNDINNALGPFQELIKCLNAMCDGINQVDNTIAGYSDFAQKSVNQLNALADPKTGLAPQVLNQVQQRLADKVATARAGIKELMDVNVIPPATPSGVLIRRTGQFDSKGNAI